ncbi:MAG: hypothetical protein FD164_975 [Nitrospirae bacterium]|nr:MAG: hypothetical protein FD164_975 [Nitrospirota bacterium]
MYKKWAESGIKLLVFIIIVAFSTSTSHVLCEAEVGALHGGAVSEMHKHPEPPSEDCCVLTTTHTDAHPDHHILTEILRSSSYVFKPAINTPTAVAGTLSAPCRTALRRSLVGPEPKIDHYFLFGGTVSGLAPPVV